MTPNANGNPSKRTIFDCIDKCPGPRGPSPHTATPAPTPKKTAMAARDITSRNLFNRYSARFAASLADCSVIPSSMFWLPAYSTTTRIVNFRFWPFSEVRQRPLSRRCWEDKRTSSGAPALNPWLPDRELAFYSAEYQRTGFQGGLQWYRCGTSGEFTGEVQTWSGRTIDVPPCFISGRRDWGTCQRPGADEAMQHSACTRMFGTPLIAGAGHWVQQKPPAEVSRLFCN